MPVTTKEPEPRTRRQGRGAEIGSMAALAFALTFPTAMACLYFVAVSPAEPADVANAVVFLASPLAKVITGANIDLGGTLRGML